MERDFSNALSCALDGGADTIVARATPAGRGALAIVRLSGGGTEAVAERVCGVSSFSEGWRTRQVNLRSADGEILERAVAISYRAPRSFTGENMLELVVHGSPYLVDEVVQSCVAAGARPAQPGEFCRRAVANGKLDLAQAEGVRDLIEAESAWQARNARLQLEGLLSERVAGLRGQVVQLLAEVETSLDFGDQDVVVDAAEVEAKRCAVLHEVQALLATEEAGRQIRDGVKVAIIGSPNAGKSTLFNNLVGRDRAIVSPEPGTTRDVVEECIVVAGVRVVLADTAGLRHTEVAVEAEGVRRARAALAGAGAVLLLWAVDGSEAEPVVHGVEGLPVIRVRSKADLVSPTPGGDGWLAVSCMNGEGMAELQAALAEVLCAEVQDLGGEVAIAERHALSLRRAADELEDAGIAEPEVMAEHLRSCLCHLEEIIGVVDNEEVLDAVFSTFCIGK